MIFKGRVQRPENIVLTTAPWLWFLTFAGLAHPLGRFGGIQL